jgi:hypothetical protein
MGSSTESRPPQLGVQVECSSNFVTAVGRRDSGINLSELKVCPAFFGAKPICQLAVSSKDKSIR